MTFVVTVDVAPISSTAVKVNVRVVFLLTEGAVKLAVKVFPLTRVTEGPAV